MSIDMVKVSDILKNVTSSCDHGDVEDYPNPETFWASLIEWKASDSGFGYLIEDILENGWDKDSSVGLHTGGNSGGDWRISEGHHRIVAAILLCMDEIPADQGGYGTDPSAQTGQHVASKYGKKISCHNPPAKPFGIKVDYGISY